MSRLEIALFLHLLAFGLWLVHIEGIGYGTGWVSWAIALYLVSLGLGGFGGRRPKRARGLAERLRDAGEPATPELRALLDDRLTDAANYLSALAVPAILVLMVFKP